MNKGYIFSGAGHLGLILWALLGGWLFSAQSVPEIKVMDVSLVSGAELDAQASKAPKVDAAAPKPAAQPPAQADPAPAPAPKPQPAPRPAAQPAALPDTLPVADSPQPDPTPPPVAPPADQPQPVPQPKLDAKPKPRQVDKIADVPVDQVPDTPKVADTPVPKPTDTPSPDVPVTPPKPEAAPEVAAPTVTPDAPPVTDNAPQLAPTASKRPPARPKLAAVKPPEVTVPDTTAADTAAADQAKADTAAADKADKIAADQAAADQAAIEAAVAAAAQGTDSASGAAPNGPPMTAGEIDGLRVAIKKCWNLSTVSSAAMQTTVTVQLRVLQDGTPDGASIRMTGFTGGSEATAKPLYEAAYRAIVRCGKDGFPLPADKYDTWKELELVFDPSGMRLR